LLLCDSGAQNDALAPGVPVRSVREAPGEYDIVLATWWETARRLFDVPAARHALFVQSFEERFYTEREQLERTGARLALALPVQFIAIGRWMQRMLAELRPDARCFLAPNGIDKSVFGLVSRASHEGPLRVLIEGQPGLPFKGVTEALAAVREMREEAHVTLASLVPPEDTDETGGADRIVSGLDQRGMAELYAETDVLLKLSRVEGVALPPIEAFHAGVPSVITPCTGHDEYLQHGQNGLVVGFDDIGGTARALDLLARDRQLLERLSAGARATAREWPSAEESTASLAAALDEIAAGPPPSVSGLGRAFDGLALAAGLSMLERSRHDLADAGLTAARAHVEELSRSREECAELLLASQQEAESMRTTLKEIRSSRLYRIYSKVRRSGR
jgi:glycosyltransferase involved in cell wall biosynthesis